MSYKAIPLQRKRPDLPPARVRRFGFSKRWAASILSLFVVASIILSLFVVASIILSLFVVAMHRAKRKGGRPEEHREKSRQEDPSKARRRALRHLFKIDITTRV
jgi:hypothetical protein